MADIEGILALDYLTKYARDLPIIGRNDKIDLVMLNCSRYNNIKREIAI